MLWGKINKKSLKLKSKDYNIDIKALSTDFNRKDT